MSEKLRKIIISAICLASVLAMSAPLTPQQALKRLNDLPERKNLKELENSLIHPSNRLIVTFNEESQPTLYLFGNNKAVIALAADDEITPLLGYSSTNERIILNQSDPEGQLPPAFLGWAEEISREIAAIRKGEGRVAERSAVYNEYRSIQPLCATKWNQAEPYNLMCPVESSGERCVTGCVATSMAQVMKYHEWPEKGEGIGEITWNGKSVKLLLSKQNYDWRNMLNVYTEGDYSDEQAQAVASIMKSCGYSVNMSYSSTGSGAVAASIAYALGAHFKYDKSKIEYVMRDYFSLDEWENMIYNSIAAYGPVILDGVSNQGAHSFVCDGYDKEGYFHINWGWGGVSDGYYLLSVLDPYNQGIGGSGDNSGFNFRQDAILNIVPNYSGEGQKWIGQLWSSGEMGVETDRDYPLEEGIKNLCPLGVYNFGPTFIPADFYIGLLFRGLNTSEIYSYPAYVDGKVDILYGVADFDLPFPEDIPEGEYRMTLSYYSPDYTGEDLAMSLALTPGSPNESGGNDSGTGVQTSSSDGWIDVKFPYGLPSEYFATVANGTVRFSTVPSSGSGVTSLSVSDSGEIRYFNLQGIPVREPLKGETVIMMKGNRAVKVIK